MVVLNNDEISQVAGSEACTCLWSIAEMTCCSFCAAACGVMPEANIEQVGVPANVPNVQACILRCCFNMPGVNHRYVYENMQYSC